MTGNDVNKPRDSNGIYRSKRRAFQIDDAQSEQALTDTFVTTYMRLNQIDLHLVKL